MELCLATVTNPAPQGPLAIQLEDSVPAGSMSSVGSARGVPQDTMASPTADHASVAVDCVMKRQDGVSALLRQSNQPVMCVRVRLSAITLCWAARPVNALQVASEQMQGLNAIVSVDSATASLGLVDGSVIVVLQVIIASLNVYHVTVKKVVSHVTCVTQTLGGVSARVMLLV